MWRRSTSTNSSSIIRPSMSLRARRCRIDQRDDLAHGRGDQFADLVRRRCCSTSTSRQGAEHRREQEFRGFEIAADEARLVAAAAVVDGPACLRSGPAGRCRARTPSPRRRRSRTCGRRQTASAECRPAPISRRSPAGVSNVQRPCADQMEDADVVQPRQRRALVEALRAIRSERRGERAVEEHRRRSGARRAAFRTARRRRAGRSGVSANEGGVSIIERACSLANTSAP